MDLNKWMKRLLVWTLAAACAAPVRAGFGDGLSTAAAEGSGNAVAAKADEAAALFVNPGALGRLDRGDLTVMYAKPLTGIPDVSIQQGVAAVAVPVGASWTLGAGARYFDDAGLAKETEGAVGAAVRMGNTSVGLAGVFLQRSFSVGSITGASSDPVFAQGTSKSAISIDAGIHHIVSERLAVGASVRNLNQPDMGLVTEDKVAMGWRAGASYGWNRFTFLGELRGKSEDSSGDSNWGAGLEWRAASPLILRVGADSEQISAGTGLTFRDLRLDYAFSFLQSLGAGEASTHRVSIGFKFGAMRGEEAVTYARPARKPAPKARTAKPATRSQAASPAKKSPSTSVGAPVSTQDTRAYPPAPLPKKKAVKRRTWVH